MPVCPYCGANLNPVFRALASKGGKAASGRVKLTRTPAEYREMQRKSVEARRRRTATCPPRRPSA